jgi:hypothetical protein
LTSLPVLGWKEEAFLPEWGIERLRVKLDTGARTSAIHVAACDTVGHYEREGQRLPIVRLRIPLSRLRPERIADVETPVIGYRSVRDTSARPERRAVVRTRLVCGPIDRDIEVTVTDRTGMIFRMILGRQALDGLCLVDPGRTYVTRGGGS